MDVALISSRENNQRLVPSESLVPFTPLLIHPEVVDTSGWYLGRHWYADKASAYVFIYHAHLNFARRPQFAGDSQLFDALLLQNRGKLASPPFRRGKRGE